MQPRGWSRVRILVRAGRGSLFPKRYFKPLKKTVGRPAHQSRSESSELHLVHFPTKAVENRARQCKKNVKIRENANCGADKPEMKYSGHTWFYLHHLYIHFWSAKKTALWRWNLPTETVFFSQDIHGWRFTCEMLIQIWRPWFEYKNVCNQYERWIMRLWSKLTKPRIRDQRVSAAAEILMIQAWDGLEWRLNGDSKSLSPLRAAECFRP